MIESVRLEYFKKFEEEVFPLDDRIVIVGPNDSGKTTLLQAIATWYLALRKWVEIKGTTVPKSKKAKRGIQITRKEFTSIPLREMRLLWTEKHTHYRKEVAPEGKTGYPRPMKISLKGRTNKQTWELAFEFRPGGREVVYAKPSEQHLGNVPFVSENIAIIHVPPFSGIGAEETVYSKEYQDLLTGQGKPGDIIRNRILEIHNAYVEHNLKGWEKLVKRIEDTFNYQLLPPKSAGRPHILCEYKDIKLGTTFDISCAGSGFLQFLMLFAFLYSRPSTILLLDEPDAHLHVILQKQVYDQLKDVAIERTSQLIIATHSEILVGATSPNRILSCFGSPHPLIEKTERDQTREALKRLTNMDMILSEQAPGILYLEGSTDLDLLRKWAKVLNHPAYKFLRERPFWHPMGGRNISEAKGHFFALKVVNKNARGYVLLDGDNRSIPNHDIAVRGLSVGRWNRYEAENYLLHPDSLLRFLKNLPTPLFLNLDSAMDYFKDELPAVYKTPLDEHPILEALAASKSFLPTFFKKAGILIPKGDYYMIAAQMKPGEIVNEVKEKLNEISAAFNIIEGDS